MPRFYLPSNYRIQNYISSGGYGDVFHCLRTVADPESGESVEEDVAVKRIHDFARRPSFSEENQTRFMRCIFREVVILSHFQDWDEFIEIKEIYLSPDLHDVYIVMPLITCSLAEVLKAREVKGQGVHEDIVRFVAFQMLNALRLMNAAGCMHRDLSPENILVQTQNNWFCYLADFGLSKAVTSPEQEHTIWVIKLPYRPPEVLLEFSQFDFTKVDVWGLGCILVELLVGRGFIHTADVRRQLEAILHFCGAQNVEGWHGKASDKALEIFKELNDEVMGKHLDNKTNLRTLLPGVSEECIDALSAALAFDSAERLSPKELLTLPWFTNHLQQQIEEVSGVPDPEPVPETENLSKEEMEHLLVTKFGRTPSHGTYVEIERAGRGTPPPKEQQEEAPVGQQSEEQEEPTSSCAIS